jgi:hypothetical protein
MHITSDHDAPATRQGPYGVGIVVGFIVSVLGLVWMGSLSPNHSSCSNALIASTNYSLCQSTDILYYLAWGLVGLGILSIITSAWAHRD